MGSKWEKIGKHSFIAGYGHYGTVMNGRWYVVKESAGNVAEGPCATDRIGREAVEIALRSIDR